MDLGCRYGNWWLSLVTGAKRWLKKLEMSFFETTVIGYDRPNGLVVVSVVSKVSAG